jgi:hypothetical protein
MLRWLALGFVSLVAVAQPAEACSPPPPGFYGVRPPSGSTIPSNAGIVLLAYTLGSAEVTITQEDAVYRVEAATDRGVPVVSIGPLGLHGEITLFATSTDPGGQSITARYVVAGATDDLPPEHDGIERADVEWFEYAPGPCQPGGFQVTVTVPAAKDDWFPTVYFLYELFPNDAVVLAGHAFHQDGEATIRLYAHPGEQEGNRCYAVTAMDVGLHTTPEIAPFGEIACVDLVRDADAGVPDARGIDTGTRPDAEIRDAGPKKDTGGGAGGLELDDPGGCGCSTMPVRDPTARRGSSHGGYHGMGAAALLVLARIRRRR